MNLSTRLKEFDTKTAKKQLCSLKMSKLLLKFFIAFYELNKSVDSGSEENEDNEEKERYLTRSIVEKSMQQAELVPDQNLFTVMLVKKSQYTREFLMLKGRH